jgi:membrane protein YdbS with pleckstrin-like domain
MDNAKTKKKGYWILFLSIFLALNFTAQLVQWLAHQHAPWWTFTFVFFLLIGYVGFDITLFKTEVQNAR